MKHTTNYNLNKPDITDNYNISHNNENMNKIDTALKENADQVLVVDEKVEAVSTQLTDIAINIKKFGAKGNWNGSTGQDDSDYLQSAFDQISSVVSASLKVPYGRYRYTKTLEIRGNTYLQGDNSILEYSLESGYSIYITGDNVIINGITFKGTNTEGLLGVGNGAVRVDGTCKNIIFIDCVFDGFNTGLLALTDNKNIKLIRCRFRNCKLVDGDVTSGYGVILQSTRDALLYDNTFEDSVYRHHIYISRMPTPGLKCDTIYVIDNKFYGRKDGALSHITGYEYLLKIMGAQNVKVRGNTFDGGVGHIFLTTYQETINDRDIKSILINENTFRNIIGMQGDNAVIAFLNRLDKSYNVSVKDNIVENCSSNFVTGNNFQYCDFKDNQIELVAPQAGLHAHGFYLYKTSDILNTKIKNNYIKIAENQRGIYAFNQSGDAQPGKYKGLEIIENTFDGGYFGIYFNSTASGTEILDVKINRNTFRGNTGNSMRFDLPTTMTGEIIGNVGESEGIIYLVGISGKLHCYGNRMTITKSSTLYLVEQFGVNGNHISYGSVAPTSDTWKVGDRVINTNPSAGNYEGWICVASGSPGTWKGYGLIST